MRFSVKTVAPLLGMALALTACGISGGDDEEASGRGSVAGSCEDGCISFFESVTGWYERLSI